MPLPYANLFVFIPVHQIMHFFFFLSEMQTKAPLELEHQWWLYWMLGLGHKNNLVQFRKRLWFEFKYTL